MITQKKPPARISTLVAALEEVELPLTPEQIKAGQTVGTIATVRPLDAYGYQLQLDIESNPAVEGPRIWELVAMCLPSVDETQVKRLNPAECAAIVAIASGQIEAVKALAAEIEGKGRAPVTTAEPEPRTSSTLSDSSASASHATLDGESRTSP